jgi:hypothetical protein
MVASVFAPAVAAIARGAAQRDARVLGRACHNVMLHERSVVDSALARLGLGSADAFLVQSANDLALVESSTRTPRVQSPLRCVRSSRTARAMRPRRGRPRRAAGTARFDRTDGALLRLIRRIKARRAVARRGTGAPSRAPAAVVAGEFYQDRAPYEARFQLEPAARCSPRPLRAERRGRRLFQARLRRVSCRALNTQAASPKRRSCSGGRHRDAGRRFAQRCGPAKPHRAAERSRFLAAALVEFFETEARCAWRRTWQVRRRACGLG